MERDIHEVEIDLIRQVRAADADLLGRLYAEAWSFGSPLPAWMEELFRRAFVRVYGDA